MEATARSIRVTAGLRDAESTTTRLLYVDQLRLFAVMTVFLGHVCEVFSPFDDWHITNVERSRVAGEITVILAPWVMPLFMLLAGVSAWHSLQRRSNGAYVRERVLRLLLPLIAGILLLVSPQVYLERRLNGQFSGSFWSFFPHFFDGIYPRGNLSWHHLWFLGHLFFYSLLALPLFRYLQRPGARALLQKMATVAGSKGGLLWLALPLILERQLLWGLFAERHMLTSDWSNHAILFVAFIYGFVLAGEPRLGEAIDKQWTSAAVLALASTVLLIASTWLGHLPWHAPAPYSMAYLAFWTLYALAAWAWIVAMLGVGRKWLDREGPVLRYARDLGYGWYLVHQTVIVAVAYMIVQTRAPIGVKLGEVLVVSLAGTLVGAELLQRLPGIGRLVSSNQRDVPATNLAVVRGSA